MGIYSVSLIYLLLKPIPITKYQWDILYCYYIILE